MQSPQDLRYWFLLVLLNCSTGWDSFVRKGFALDQL